MITSKEKSWFLNWYVIRLLEFCKTYDLLFWCFFQINEITVDSISLVSVYVQRIASKINE